MYPLRLDLTLGHLHSTCVPFSSSFPSCLFYLQQVPDSSHQKRTSLLTSPEHLLQTNSKNSSNIQILAVSTKSTTLTHFITSQGNSQHPSEVPVSSQMAKITSPREKKDMEAGKRHTVKISLCMVQSSLSNLHKSL